MNDLVLDLMTGMPVLLDEYKLPQLATKASIVKGTEEGVYTLLGTNNTIQIYAKVPELLLVTQKGTNAVVVPREVANQTDRQSAIDVSFDGDPSLLLREDGDLLECQVYTMTQAKLYNRESWSTEQDLRYEQAVIASQKTAWMSEPINVIFYPLSIAQETIKQWKSVRAARLTGDAKYSSDLSIITPEYVDEQIEKWSKAQELLTPLSEFAVAERITNPLSPGQASIEQRVHRINAILAAWNLDHCAELEQMNSEGIGKLFEDISEKLGGKKIDLPKVEAGKPALIEGKPQSDTPGATEKTTSPKSGKSSSKSLPQGTDTPSSDAAESPSEN